MRISAAGARPRELSQQFRGTPETVPAARPLPFHRMVRQATIGVDGRCILAATDSQEDRRPRQTTKCEARGPAARIPGKLKRHSR